MPFFLLITCVAEIAGRYYSLNNRDNDWIYNLYMIAETGFTLRLFSALIGPAKVNRRLYVATLNLFLLLYGLETAKHGIVVFHNITTTVLSVLFIGYGLYYYLLLIRSEQDVSLGTYAPFWWVAGTLCFYYCSTVSELYFTVFSSRNERLYTYRHTVYIVLNLILYGCWSYSFICRYRQRRSIH